MSVKSLLFAIFLITCSIHFDQINASKSSLELELTNTQSPLIAPKPLPVIKNPYTRCYNEGKKLEPICTKEYKPVCAYQHGICEKPPCYSTASNACMACVEKAKDGSYLNHGYLSGDCSNYPYPPMPTEATYCQNRYDVEQRGCPKNISEVCAYHYGDEIQCIKAPCARTYDNSCMACQDLNQAGISKINYYYIPGSCSKIEYKNLRKACVKEDTKP